MYDETLRVRTKFHRYLNLIIQFFDILKYPRLEISFTGPVENFIAELNRTRQLEPDTEMPMNRIEYETAAVISKLLQLSMEYYDHICSNDDSNEEKCCLIPICALSPISANPLHHQNASLSETVETDNHKDSEDVININGKRMHTSHSGSDSGSSNSSSSDSPDIDKPSQSKKQKEAGGKYMTKDVEEALFILNCASQCLHHLDELSGKRARQSTPPTDSSASDWTIGECARTDCDLQ